MVVDVGEGHGVASGRKLIELFADSMQPADTVIRRMIVNIVNN